MMAFEPIFQPLKFRNLPVKNHLTTAARAQTWPTI
jgi:hypothetical protein